MAEGTLTNTVAPCVSIRSNSAFGVEGSSKRTADAPTENGKKRFEPIA
jgi:hypothetical protein